MICSDMSDNDLHEFFENARCRFIDAIPFTDEEEAAEHDLERARVVMADRFAEIVRKRV